MRSRFDTLTRIGHDFTGVIYDVNPATGAATNPRGGGGVSLSGITRSPVNGVYYGVSASLGVDNILYSIDTTTGALTQIGFGTGLGALIEGDLDFHPGTHALYGMYGRSYKLFTLDTADGTASAVGEMAYPDRADPSALAFDAGGTLYVLDPAADVLLTVDPATANVQTIVPLTPPLPIASLAGMDFHPTTGVLFVATGNTNIAGQGTLYTLDPTTGSLTEIGPLGIGPGGLAGLEFTRFAECDTVIDFQSLRHEDGLVSALPGIHTYSEDGFVFESCHDLATLGTRHARFGESTALHWIPTCDSPTGTYWGVQMRAENGSAFSVCSLEGTELTVPPPDRPVVTFQAETPSGTIALSHRLDGDRWLPETITGLPVDMTGLFFGPSVQIDNICICENPPPSCIEPPAGLVSWYAGDDCTAGDRAGFRHGTFVGPIVCPDDSKVGPQSMQFESSSGNSVSVPHSSALEPALGDFTLDMWVKVPAGQGGLSGDRTLVTKGFAYTLRLLDGRPTFEACDTSFCMIPLQSSETLSPDAWHMVSVVILRTTGEVRLFVDNNVNFQPFGLGNVSDPGAPFRIGAFSPGVSQFDGLIDELEVFKRGLSFNELGEIRDAGSRGKCKIARNVTPYGQAQGGDVTMVLSGTPLNVPTQPSDSGVSVARSLVDAVTNNATLAGRGISAMADRNAVLIAGAPLEAISWSDPGIQVALGPFALRPVDLEGELWEWNAMPGATGYDLVRGGLGTLFDDGAAVHLGAVVCIEGDSADTTTAAGTEIQHRDSEIPAPGAGFFYLVRQNAGLGAETYGFGDPSEHERFPAVGDCP